MAKLTKFRRSYFVNSHSYKACIQDTDFAVPIVRTVAVW